MSIKNIVLVVLLAITAMVSFKSSAYPIAEETVANEANKEVKKLDNKKLPISDEMRKAMENTEKNLQDGLTSSERIVKYVKSGFVHIVPMGLDHILFVLGLFFSTVYFSKLIWQVTTFTLAHSITLGLAASGWITIGAEVIEPLIALSIVYLAYENIKNTEPENSRLIVIFLFGLLHGLGFAFVLQEFGMSQTHFLSSLFAFNIGVELGQLSVLLAALVLFYYWSKKPSYRSFVQIPMSLFIGVIGLFWLFERTIG